MSNTSSDFISDMEVTDHRHYHRYILVSIYILEIKK